MNERLVPESTQPHPTGAADPVATQAEVRALAQHMVDYRFTARYGTPRSKEYQAGFKAGLLSSLAGETITYPYQTGTAAADAYFSGILEGQFIGKHTLETSMRPAKFSAGRIVKLLLSRQRGRVKSWFPYENRRIYLIDFGEDIGVSATSYAEETSLMAVEDLTP